MAILYEQITKIYLTEDLCHFFPFPNVFVVFHGSLKVFRNLTGFSQVIPKFSWFFLTFPGIRQVFIKSDKDKLIRLCVKFFWSSKSLSTQVLLKFSMLFLSFIQFFLVFAYFSWFLASFPSFTQVYNKFSPKLPDFSQVCGVSFKFS